MTKPLQRLRFFPLERAGYSQYRRNETNCDQTYRCTRCWPDFGNQENIENKTK